MVELVNKICTNILMAVYQPFWFALILSISIMFLYLFANYGEGAGKGYKYSIKIWILKFKSEKSFRILFFLIFYTVLVLFRTLLNRDMWMNPLSDILGGWTLYKKNVYSGELELSTECIENIILLIPFSYCVLRFKESKDTKKHSVRRKIYCSFRVSLMFSLSIEVLQLLLRVGTFQLADIVYNTLGGIFGALLFVVVRKIEGKISNE